MNANRYRSHPIAAAIAATFVTTMLVSTLVDSFEPAQLIQLDKRAAGDQVVAALRRSGTDVLEWA